MLSRERLEEALDDIPVERRLVTLPPSANVWRTLWSRAGHPAVERLAGPLDVFHFSDWMYPRQRGGAALDDRPRPHPAALPRVGAPADAPAEPREVRATRPAPAT